MLQSLGVRSWALMTGIFSSALTVDNTNVFWIYRHLKHRITFQCGDFIHYRGSSIGRIDHIFIHEVVKGQKRMFAVVKRVVDQKKKDHVLNLPILWVSDETDIVGLPAITGRKLYIISVKQRTGGGLDLGGRDLLFVDWQIQFLWPKASVLVIIM